MIQRGVEIAGIPTVAVANLKMQVERVGYPRAAVVKFPRGATVGRPNDPKQQRGVIQETLRLLQSAQTPGALVELTRTWAG